VNVAAIAHVGDFPHLVHPVPAPVQLVAVPDTDIESHLAEAEELARGADREAALDLLDELWPAARHVPALALRHRLATAWIEMYRGDLDLAGELLTHAEAIVDSPLFDAVDRAQVLYRRGCLTLQQSHIAEATMLFTRALETNTRSGRQSSTLAADALNWRSRCHQLRRDWDAAARDAEASLELAEDDHTRANALFQISLVSERQRQWLLARFYGEQALELYRAEGDRLSSARILNNLGGIEFLLGDVEAAERHLVEAASEAEAAGSDADVAQATSSLAQILLEAGRAGDARVLALHAVEMLEGRVDFFDELGNAQLVVARAFAADDEVASAEHWFGIAEATFTSFGGTSQLAAAWMARGDLAHVDGDLTEAAALYKRAAEALQDFHF
jgi:tetratricopeptide (TPR) repeat protein